MYPNVCAHHKIARNKKTEFPGNILNVGVIFSEIIGTRLYIF